jgi:2,4-dienoyl-CoA reductase-like NADH-dependent reductase (Old Yellow Enzyme family)
VEEIQALPRTYAEAAERAKSHGFTGVEVRAGHGFLLSQFLSPLFNHRTDGYGGSIEGRSRIIVDILREVRAVVGPNLAIGIKINASDQLDGGLTEADSKTAIEIIGNEAIDLIDISGGTYFPGAPSSSDRQAAGPYFVEFAREVRKATEVPLMVTGGFKTYEQAADAVASAATDVVGLARALVVDPELPSRWLGSDQTNPLFPRVESPPPGGVTAWYTMRLTDIARHDDETDRTPTEALEEYEARDDRRVSAWIQAFGVSG